MILNEPQECVSDDDCYDYDGCIRSTCNISQCNNTILAEEDCQNCSWFELNLTTDYFPEETSWIIYDFYNNAVVSEGNNTLPPPGGRSKMDRLLSENRKSLSKTLTNSWGNFKSIRNLDLSGSTDSYLRICLKQNILYRFVIMDSFGDGICCEDSNSSYVISIQDKILRSGGKFEYSEELYFLSNPNLDTCPYNSLVLDQYHADVSTCVYKRRPCEEYGAIVNFMFVTDADPTENSWQITKDNTVQMSRGLFQIPFAEYKASKCFPYGSYTLQVLDNAGNGLTNCRYLSDTLCGSYNLVINDKLIISNDGSFGKEMNYTFGICTEDQQCSDNDPCTEDTCDLLHNTCIFKLVCQGCSKELVTIGIEMDNLLLQNTFLNQTTWTITDQMNNETIYSGGPYTHNSTSYEHRFCVAIGHFQFNIFDGRGFGLCSSDGINCGKYEVKVNDVKILGSNGIFYYEKHHTFNIMNLEANDDWFLEFDFLNHQRSSSGILQLSLEYSVAKGKLLNQIVTKILDYNCEESIIRNTLKYVESRVLENEYSYFNNLMVTLNVNETDIKNSPGWEKNSESSGFLSFCAREELMLNDNISVSFIETKIKLKMYFESSIMVESFSAEKQEISQVHKQENFHLNSCVCNDILECVETVFEQNALLQVCVYASDELKVVNFENLIMYQNGIAKYSPITNGNHDELTLVSFGNIGVVQSRLVSSFFENTDIPSPVMIKGEVALDFLHNRRELYESEMQVQENVSFELMIPIANVSKQSAESLFLLALTLIISALLVLKVKRRKQKHRYKSLSLVENN